MAVETPNILVAIQSVDGERSALNDGLTQLGLASQEVHHADYEVGVSGDRADNELALRTRVSVAARTRGPVTLVAIGETTSSLVLGALKENPGIIEKVVTVDSGIPSMTEGALPTGLRTRVTDIRTVPQGENAPAFLQGAGNTVVTEPRGGDSRLSGIRAAMHTLGVGRALRRAA